MDPIIGGAIKVITVMKGFYDARKLREQLETIESTLVSLGVRMEQVLDVDVRAAYRHLEAADMAASDQFRRNELMLARSSFVRMTERPIESLTATQSRLLQTNYRELAGKWVAAVGHAGNFSYMLMNDEPRLALREAYLCCERFPMLGVQLFPVELFSQDFRPAARALVSRSERRDQSRDRHQRMAAVHKENRAEYYREMAWKVPLAGVVFLGSLAAGAVAPPLAAQAPMRALGILQGTGQRSVLDIPSAVPKLDFGADATDPPEEVDVMRRAGQESASRLRQLDASSSYSRPTS
jgi:hypothetical protein